MGVRLRDYLSKKQRGRSASISSIESSLQNDLSKAYQDANDTIRQEVAKAIKAFEKVGSTLEGKTKKAILKRAAVVMRDEIRGNAPISDVTHYRYNTGKLTKSIRAPKGMGNVVAAYTPGNLERSIKLLRTDRIDGWLVGPKVAKGSSYGLFDGARVDAYYAHWVEFGAPGAGIPATPFVRPAVATGAPKVAQVAKEDIQKAIAEVVRKIAVK